VIKGFTRRFEPLNLLSEGEEESIHRGALYVLEKTGMRIDHEGALNLLSEVGCRVDFEANQVRFPAAIVEDSIRKCPSSYVLKARDPDNDLVIGGNTFYFMQGMGMRYMDLDTWETRPATIGSGGIFCPHMYGLSSTIPTYIRTRTSLQLGQALTQ
jgi:trimethylamine--corrinoid protein Co-methyltransferase